MKDAVATMGSLLPDDVGGRDAVHVAVISVVAGSDLFPSDHVGIAGQSSAGEHVANQTVGSKQIGIVDPFLIAPVLKGQRFWLYLYPRTITGLRHSWTHPDIPDDRKVAAEAWIRNFAERAGVPGGHKGLMSAVNWMVDGGHRDVVFGEDANGEIPPEFWDHFEVVTGKKARHRPDYFRCAC